MSCQPKIITQNNFYFYIFLKRLKTSYNGIHDSNKRPETHILGSVHAVQRTYGVWK